MISSITFYDANNDVMLQIQGSVEKKGEKYTIELDAHEYIVGCEQFNMNSLRDIKFMILDKSKLPGWIPNTGDSSTFFDSKDFSGIKESSLK